LRSVTAGEHPMLLGHLDMTAVDAATFLALRNFLPP